MFEAFKSELSLQGIEHGIRTVAVPDLQNSIENQFGFLPEFHRRYDDFYQCRLVQYLPELGYVRFDSIVIPSHDDYLTAAAVPYFAASGSITEYQLLDPKTKDRVSRSVTFIKDHEGKLELSEAGVYYRKGILDTEYRTSYHENDSLPEDAAVDIYFNESIDREVWFPYTKLVQAFRFTNEPWEIQIAHGSFQELEAYYKEQRRKVLEREEITNAFPGVLLQLPAAGSDVLVYEDRQGRALVPEKPKQIDLIQLSMPKVIVYRGLYLYVVNVGSEVVIKRDAQEQDGESWELTIFNEDNEQLDQAIKDDWVHLKDNLVSELVRK